MIVDKQVAATTGEIIPIVAETICIHGDGAHAVAFAKQINQRLTANRIKIKPISI